jgi:hypothetical protein
MSFDEVPDDWRKAGTMFANKDAFDMVREGLTKSRMFGKAQRAVTYVNCWHMSPYESAAMWKTYLESDEGIAIQSTINRFKESISKYDAFNIFVGEVIYVDFDTALIPGDNMLWPFIHKRRSFEYEHELRALIWDGQHSKMDFNNIENVPNVPTELHVTTDLDTLIEKIYVSPQAEAWFRDLLLSVCSRYNLNKGIVHSDLASTLY